MTNKKVQPKNFEHKGVVFKGTHLVICGVCSKSMSLWEVAGPPNSCHFGAVGDNVLLLNEGDIAAPFVSYLTTICITTGHASNVSERPESLRMTNLHVQICKIENIVVKGKDAAMRVKWFYRPEETCSGRRVGISVFKIPYVICCSTLFSHCYQAKVQAFHSLQEVMASDHVELLLQPAASIVSKCKIHSLEQYMVGLYHNLSKT